MRPRARLGQPRFGRGNLAGDDGYHNQSSKAHRGSHQRRRYGPRGPRIQVKMQFASSNAVDRPAKNVVTETH